MTYSAVGLIPFKETSERVPGKNFKTLGRKPLFEHIITKAVKSSKLEKVFVCTNSEFGKKRARELGAEVLDCPNWYFEPAITGDKLLSYPAEQIDADIYVQLFATAPFLRSETIDQSIQMLQESDTYDSVLTVQSKHDWVWYKGNPITYYPGHLPRSQDASPIVVESTGLYAMKGTALKELKRRVGNKPYFLEIDEIEGWDIDTPLQFRLAELFMDNIHQMEGITNKKYF